jgi:two-component sensor histidine kinase/CheY-like chemotaxis protein
MEEMEGWGWKSVHHPEHVDRVVESVRKAGELGEPWEDTFPLRGRDGRYRWFLSRAVPIRDDDGKITRWFGTNTDITERLEHEKQLRTVMAELNHRVKNTLAVVNAIANQTLKRSTDLGVFAESFNQRLRSIAKAHSLLTSTEWSGCGLDEVVHSELDARAAGDRQLAVSGPPVTLLPKHCLAIHMVLHELATNASKYGALKDGKGRIEITWSTAPRAGTEWLRIDWTEHCEHRVTPPGTNGYGSRLIRQSVTYDLHGEFESRYTPAGFQCRISFPLTATTAARTGPQATTAPAEAASHPRRVLVVEDNVLLAMSLTEDLRELGVDILGPANTVEKGTCLAETQRPSAAILDVDLDGTKVYPLARMLRERGVPFVLLTGYELQDLPEDLRDAPVFSKPISRSQIERLVTSPARAD